MGNVWGTANPTAVSAPYTAGGDVVCASGAQQLVLVSATTLTPSPGNYYPVMWGNLVLLLGATPPTACIYQLNIGGGSASDTQTVPPAQLVANATLNLPIAMVGPVSNSFVVGIGNFVGLWVTATAQPVTFKFNGSRMIIALFRGPDS